MLEPSEWSVYKVIFCKAAEVKYNQLIAKFGGLVAEFDRPGATAPSWKYFDVFTLAFPPNICTRWKC